MRNDTFWFKARRYGWGWGLPATWQGWLVYGAFVALAGLSAAAFLPTQRVDAFLACTAALTAVLIGICATKGERPQWRWGR